MPSGWRSIKALAMAAVLGLPVPPLAAQTSRLSLEDLLRELDGPGGMDAVARVQILRIDMAAEDRDPVTERFIEANAQVRCEMAFTDAQRIDFLTTLHAAAPEIGASGADLRWSAIFLDRQGVPLHRLSINGRYLLAGRGRRGYLDGIALALAPGLSKWFDRTLAACRSPPSRR